MFIMVYMFSTDTHCSMLQQYNTELVMIYTVEQKEYTELSAATSHTHNTAVK